MSAQADQRGGIEQILSWLRRLRRHFGSAADDDDWRRRQSMILRNFFDAGLYWGDSLVRVTVLWVALVGAMVASRDDSHIRIDLLSRMFKPEHEHWVLRLTRLFTCLMLVLFTWGSGQFVYYEYVDNAIAFGDVPAWICEIIMPIGGGVMALRYFLLTVKP